LGGSAIAVPHSNSEISEADTNFLDNGTSVKYYNI
jgi:hypothetical protein